LLRKVGVMHSKVGLRGKAALLGMAFALCLGLVQIGSARTPQTETSKAKTDVYVCDCMGTKSCPCMSMSNKEGKCPCGKEMKAVARDSTWAKHNRKELR
jgi:hypothetical protein